MDRPTQLDEIKALLLELKDRLSDEELDEFSEWLIDSFELDAFFG
jgi:hypothetical protein